MDSSNSFSVEESVNNLLDHHDLANSIKQMLKVGNHTAQNGQSAALDGSGDGIQSKATEPEEEIIETLPDLNLLQGETDSSNYTVIEMSKIEDGTCVEICKKEAKIIASLSTEMDSGTPASNKVKISTITKFEWERKYYSGNLVSVTNDYIAYSIQGRAAPSVRVINRVNASDRVLLKGFSGFVCDVAFSHSSSNVIGALDCKGNLIIWSLEQTGDNMTAEKMIHIQADETAEESSSHRLVWIPHVQTDSESSNDEELSSDFKPDTNDTGRVFALTHSNVAEVWDLNMALGFVDRSSSTEVKRSDLSHAFVKVDDHSDEITDCELSPIGNVLASASCDGFVKFWQVQIEDRVSPLTCLHRWMPHNGKPVSCVKFCDDKKQSELSVYWRFLLTGCERNSELKLWCTVSWNCLQVIKFAASTPAHAPPEFNVVLHSSSDFLVLSDIHRNVLYVMQCRSKIEDGHAQLTSISQYHLTSPLLSMAFIEACPCRFKSALKEKSGREEDQDFDLDEDIQEEQSSKEGDSKLDGVLIKVIAIQPRSLQSLDVRFFPNENVNECSSPLNTYNTISDDIKDIVSVSSIEDNINSTIDENSIDKNVSEISQKSPDLTHIQDPTSPPLIFPHPGEAPDVTHSSSSPPVLLLTPDAFMGPLKSNLSESANSSITHVTPFSNNPSSHYQPNQDNTILLGPSILTPLSLGPSSSNLPEENTTTTPPPSPVAPCSSSSPLPSVPQFLSSFVSSPDLISSTSALETNISSALQCHGSNPASIASVEIMTTPTDHTPSETPSLQSWPKAPDVTMSKPSSVRSPSMRNKVDSKPNETDPQIQPPEVIIEPQDEILGQDSPILHSGLNRDHEILEMLSSLKDEQAAMRIEHQKDLQSIYNKQNQLHQILKNHDSANKKLEQQGDRMEKNVKTLSDLPRKLSSDLKSIQTNINDSTASKLDRVVKSEIKKTVLPGLALSIDPIKEQLNTTISQKLTAVDSVMRENIQKLVSSKEMTDSIALATAKAVQSDIQTALPNIFFSTVVPAFERNSQAMFQQLSSTYHRGMEEMVGKLEKNFQFRLKPDQERLQSLVKEACDVTVGLQNACKNLTADIGVLLQKSLTEQIEKTMTRCESRISANVEELLKRQEKSFADQQSLIRDAVTAAIDERWPPVAGEGASGSRLSGQGTVGPRPVVERPSVVDQQQRVLKMLQQGNVNTAFQTALTAADLALVMYVCETVDPAIVFGVSPCPLQQPILLSLIQQLSSDLASKTDIKLKYLQEAVMNLDRRHQVTQEYMHSVLSALVQKLQSCAQGPLENPSISKDLKMLAMAAQSLMK